MKLPYSFVLAADLILQAVRNYRYDNDPLLAACGISIEKQLTQVNGRVLETPKVNILNLEWFDNMELCALMNICLSIRLRKGWRKGGGKGGNTGF